MWREANVYLMDISLKFIDKHDNRVRDACAELSKYCSFFPCFVCVYLTHRCYQLSIIQVIIASSIVWRMIEIKNSFGQTSCWPDYLVMNYSHYLQFSSAWEGTVLSYVFRWCVMFAGVWPSFENTHAEMKYNRTNTQAERTNFSEKKSQTSQKSPRVYGDEIIKFIFKFSAALDRCLGASNVIAP